ncbi:hypothetical protein [Falsiroseomonas oryzae]|uniref:hypothetical protein n=1 Tax=Falsiroseomonas oryzae TaxID=2766473 RepID=UPI0022EA798D|nr:hypothetical protein [Roseomonas sp. MO-31]
MPVMTAPLNSVEAQQVAISAATSASETAGIISVVIQPGTTNEQLRRALRVAADAARRDANVFRG